MNLQIRPATPDDLPAVVRIMNAISPDNMTSLEEIASQDARRREDIVFKRFVAVLDGRVVGVMRFGQDEWIFDPHKFYVGVSVLPEHQAQGIGGVLYKRMLEELEPYQPTKLTAFTREDRVRAVQFARDRGWQEEMRSWESRLNLTSFDASRFTPTLERVRNAGYEIVTFAQLASDPERERKYYDLDMDASRDVPLAPGASFTYPSMERYWQNARNNPNFDPTLFFVAVKNGGYAGLTQLSKAASPGLMHTGFTGVARAHRGQGLALALKVKALEHAKSLGISEVETSNAQSNRPMLAINERLGFEKQPAWIDFALHVRQEKAS